MLWKELSTPAENNLPGLHPLVTRALLHRGVTDPGFARAFMDPAWYQPTPASNLPGLITTVDRLQQAIHTGENICIWGDFDVDGQTSTTLLFQALKTLGSRVTYHIPVRHLESHGITLPKLKEEIDKGAQVILTCDTGISACEAADYARSRKVDLLITDHHDLPAELPTAAAIVNPKMLPSEHPLATLSGVGVAYKLAEELYARSNPRVELPELFDLVALGLVVDVAVLRGDARYLTQKGIECLRNSSRLGLKMMMEMAGLSPANLTEEHIGFTLGPRLNALGRLGDANPVVEFLTTTDSAKAHLLAVTLENYNARRQLLTRQVVDAAQDQLRNDPGLLASPVLVVGHPAWDAGIIGLAASRLVEHYAKPAIVLSTPPGEAVRGSARSVEGFHITQAISAQADLLLGYGGHPMAAGLSMAPENLPEFIRSIQKTAEKMLADAPLQEPALEISTWMSLTDLDLELANAIELLAPFGSGNPRLVLACRDLALSREPVSIGRNKEHLKLTVSDTSGKSMQVVWWDGAGEETPSGRFDLAFTLRASNWQGRQEVQLVLADWHPVAESQVTLDSRKVEVRDFRGEKDLHSLLARLSSMPSTLIFAEAEEKALLEGVDRNELNPADHLVLWSVPPSPSEFRLIMDRVNPRSISLVCAAPAISQAGNFIPRLLGLLKYTLKQLNGTTSLEKLAAACGQRSVTVKQGLDWCNAQGDFVVEFTLGENLAIRRGDGKKDAPASTRIWAGLQAILEETDAYREHFRTADKDSLLTGIGYN